MISNRGELNREEGAWTLSYKHININGKNKGVIRFDWESNYKIWEEKDFIEYIKKLK